MKTNTLAVKISMVACMSFLTTVISMTVQPYLLIGIVSAMFCMDARDKAFHKALFVTVTMMVLGAIELSYLFFNTHIAFILAASVCLSLYATTLYNRIK